MSINASYAGREYAPNAPYQVGREKIREFAAATGNTHPAHLDLEAARGLGYPDLLAPVTFAVIIAQRAEAQLIEDPDAGIDFSRVVHAEQSYEWSRPLRAGERLEATCTIESIRERAGAAFLVLRTDLRDEAGSTVAVARATLLERAPA